jgi:hypothetical protein
MFFEDGAYSLDWLASYHLAGGISLGTLHNQHFYAVRVNGNDLRLPFSARPFSAMIDMTRPVDDVILKKYAVDLIRHGCVQSICRGEEANHLTRLFDDMAESGALDSNGVAFTAMCMEDEPLDEAIRYFSLPCGLAQTKLILVIGGEEQFREVVGGFYRISGLNREKLDEESFTDADCISFTIK